MMKFFTKLALPLLLLSAATGHCAYGQDEEAKPFDPEKMRGEIFECRVSDWTQDDYDRAVAAMFRAYEKSYGAKIRKGEKGRVGIKVYTNSGAGMATPVELTEAVIDQLERRGYKRGDVTIVDMSRRKLRESGYLPEAVVNFLALLGWNPGDDREILSMDELISLFSFEHCSKSGAKFDFEKGKWFNHKYLQEISDERLAEMFLPILAENGHPEADLAYTARVVALVKGRINFVRDLWEQSRFFYEAPTAYAEKDVRKRWKEGMPQIMEELIGVLDALTDFSSAAAESTVLDWIAAKGYHTGNVMNAFRLTVVGECKGPHMFDITELLGKDETIKRIRKGINDIRPIEA